MKSKKTVLLESACSSEGKRLHRRALLTAMPLALCLFMPGLALAGSYDDFFTAVKLNDDETVRKLLQRGFDPNTTERDRGDSGLILALREDANKVVDVLINAKNVNLELKSRNGDSALLIAAYRGNLKAVTDMLAKGAEPNRPGWTALHYAAAVGRNDIVQLLLDHAAYIDAGSANGTTPMMMAARDGHILTVKLLLDEGADATLRNTAGWTAIDFAKSNNHKDIAEGLTFRLQKAGKL